MSVQVKKTLHLYAYLTLVCMHCHVINAFRKARSYIAIGKRVLIQPYSVVITLRPLSMFNVTLFFADVLLLVLIFACFVFSIFYLDFNMLGRVCLLW